MNLIKHYKFYIKNFLISINPYIFSYYRSLRKEFNPQYDHQIHIHSIRKKYLDKPNFEENEIYARRRYDSYEEYVTHQKLKFDEMVMMRGNPFTKSIILNYRNFFFNEFLVLEKFLLKSAKCICLGARQGTEVEVLRDIGYKKSKGIDLNPGKYNKLVEKGDFMKMKYSDNSICFTYSNAVDHVYDIKIFLDEIIRVTRYYCMLSIDIKNPSGSFESFEIKDTGHFISLLRNKFSSILSDRINDKWRILLLQI